METKSNTKELHPVQTLIIPDLHGNWKAMLKLMEAAGAINGDGRRVAGWTTVQLGDALNCVLESVVEDEETLEALPEYVDIYLVGNHEYSYWGGAFSGFFHHMPIKTELHRMWCDGYLRAAHLAGNVVITHAGIVPDVQIGQTDAQYMVDYLNATWMEDPRAPEFDAVGRSRGGWHDNGGVLWADHSEPKWTGYSQVFGHTVDKEVRHFTAKNSTEQICLDLGVGKNASRIAGAIIYDGKIDIAYANLEA